MWSPPEQAPPVPWYKEGEADIKVEVRKWSLRCERAAKTRYRYWNSCNLENSLTRSLTVAMLAGDHCCLLLFRYIIRGAQHKYEVVGIGTWLDCDTEWQGHRGMGCPSSISG